ncbi:MAG: hypothetical protein ACJAUZ_003309 [Flavobacteriaceae bacterium]|jgi:hypothetical protein
MDPTAVSGDAFWQRLERISEAVAEQPDARLPGSQRVERDSVTIDEGIWGLAQTLTR